MMPLEKSVARPSPTPQRLGDEARNAAAAAAPAAAVEVSRVDVHETSAVQILNAMNENIRSLGEVDFLAYGVPRPSHLVSLSLHSNRLSSLEGFASLTMPRIPYRDEPSRPWDTHLHAAVIPTTTALVLLLRDKIDGKCFNKRDPGQP